jgi:5-methyltetrahydrofolate--homocysteine methyltransferase
VELEFKPDFELARRRWGQFWRGESTGPLLWAVRPRPGVEPIPRPGCYVCAFGDIEPVIEQAIGWAATHEFLDGAIPGYQVTFAPDHFAALLGADLRNTEGSSATNWIQPFVRDWDDVEIRFQPEGKWWQRTAEVISRFRRRCDGRLIVYGTHLQGGLDCLVALRGAEGVLCDLLDVPEKVLDALKRVDRAIDDVRAALAEALDVATYGSLNRFGMYSRGLIDVPQCDASCMISPELFERFELPSLTHELAGLDASIYHLDGPGAIRHLEAICSLEKLDMIQWVPGAGQDDKDWSDLRRRIDDLGKGQIYQASANLIALDIKEIWESFSSRKLYFQVSADVHDELKTLLAE